MSYQLHDAVWANCYFVPLLQCIFVKSFTLVFTKVNEIYMEFRCILKPASKQFLLISLAHVWFNFKIKLFFLHHCNALGVIFRHVFFKHHFSPQLIVLYPAFLFRYPFHFFLTVGITFDPRPFISMSHTSSHVSAPSLTGKLLSKNKILKKSCYHRTRLKRKVAITEHS